MSRKASRRSFLKESALLGAAYYVGSPKFSRSSTPSVIVVGAGAFGGWTALHLVQRGAKVTLLDAWGPGHGVALFAHASFISTIPALGIRVACSLLICVLLIPLHLCP